MNQDSSANVRLPTAKLARRRALLAGLGKGSALIAAASPLQALATGRIVAPNGGQCTLSGNGSILVSHTANSVATPCGMVGPSAYVKVTPDLAKDATQLSGIAESTLNGLSLNGVYPWLGASNSLRLVVKTNSLTGNNARFALVEWLIAPPGIVPPTATFTDALGAGSGLVHDSLLYGLYAGTRPSPNAAASEAAIFAAAYLGAGQAAPAGLVAVPFDRRYVSTAWRGPDRSAAAVFFLSIFA